MTTGLSPTFLQAVKAAEDRLARAMAEMESLDEKIGKISRNSETLELQGRDPKVEMAAARQAKMDADAVRQRARQEVFQLFEEERKRWEAAKQAVWIKHFEKFQVFKNQLTEIAELIRSFSDSIDVGANELSDEGGMIDRWAEEFRAAVVVHQVAHNLSIANDANFRGMVIAATKTAISDSRILFAVEDLRRKAGVSPPSPPPVPEPIKFLPGRF